MFVMRYAPHGSLLIETTAAELRKYEALQQDRPEETRYTYERVTAEKARQLVLNGQHHMTNFDVADGKVIYTKSPE